MEEEGTKTCPNCKREIPSRNYNIHTIHCARNIKVCHVCKEPVPLGELDDHHEKLHKFLPCKECGESICGTDLEDHIRDSCAHTMKSCRFCDLDLQRGELPGHERYCGARTEQCSECGEWVMHRYKQLHIDSNHGFLRLDDDPEPIKKTKLVKPLGNLTNGYSNSKTPNPEPSTSKNTNLNCMQREFGQSNPVNQSKTPKDTARSPVPTASGYRELRTIENELIRPGSSNGAIPRIKRTNDQPQVNKAGAAPDKVSKNLWSRGAVKKRPAPPPPAPRTLPAQRAEQRRVREERERAEQTAINLAQGLPPVLSAAEKLDKLRKMDALHNREVEDKSYKNILQGRVWKTPDVYTGHVVAELSSLERNEFGTIAFKFQAEFEVGFELGRAPIDRAELDRQRDSLKDFVPMTPEEFGERFRTLQLGGGSGAGDGGGGLGGDRFSQIKSSLRELRRGLNEVTAPYNQNLVSEVGNTARGRRPNTQALAGAHAVADAGADDEVSLPCEFCDVLVPLEDLVIHQTGCRPDLAQLRPVEAPRRPAAAGDDTGAADVTDGAGAGDVIADGPDAGDAAGAGEPVIPCEFCAQYLPIELITEHQVRCERESRLLFPD